MPRPVEVGAIIHWYHPDLKNGQLDGPHEAVIEGVNERTAPIQLELAVMRPGGKLRYRLKKVKLSSYPMPGYACEIEDPPKVVEP